jgi:hypothetical protein
MNRVSSLLFLTALAGLLFLAALAGLLELAAIPIPFAFLLLFFDLFLHLLLIFLVFHGIVCWPLRLFF